MSNKWFTNSGKLIKTFNFANFKEALKFINQVGEVSERLNHHPKITNIYKLSIAIRVAQTVGKV